MFTNTYDPVAVGERQLGHLGGSSNSTSTSSTAAVTNSTVPTAASGTSSSSSHAADGGTSTTNTSSHHGHIVSTPEGAESAAALTAPTIGPFPDRSHFLGHPDFLYLVCLVAGVAIVLLSNRVPKLFTTAGSLVAGVWIGLIFMDLQDHNNTATDEWWLPLFCSVASSLVLLVVLNRWIRIGIGVLSSMMIVVQLLALLRLLQVNVERDVLGKIHHEPFYQYGVWIYLVLALLTCGMCVLSRFSGNLVVNATSVALGTLLVISACSYFLQRAINSEESERMRNRRGFALLDDLARVTSQVRYEQCGRFLPDRAAANGLWEKGGCDCKVGCVFEILAWFFSKAGVLYLQRRWRLRWGAKEEAAPLRNGADGAQQLPIGKASPPDNLGAAGRGGFYELSEDPEVQLTAGGYEVPTAPPKTGNRV
ncbi:unnamed protein product [Amoebophrya sp. A120]|nr:unnamed protein product [Amoebophrya sp. A120]|eukprot:GSA120T00018405001.1